MFLQNLKSIALSVPQIIGVPQKIWTVPGYALAPGLRQRELVSTPRLAITLGHNYVDVNLHIAAHFRMLIAL